MPFCTSTYHIQAYSINIAITMVITLSPFHNKGVRKINLTVFQKPWKIMLMPHVVSDII